MYTSATPIFDQVYNAYCNATAGHVDYYADQAFEAEVKGDRNLMFAYTEAAKEWRDVYSYMFNLSYA